MDHGEAIKMMAAERYLLEELTQEERASFEQHAFDCQECAMDLRAGAAFMKEAKAQLAEPAMQSSTPPVAASSRPESKKKNWSFLWRPVFALPAFAVMLTVLAYQNFSTIPGLRRAADEPRIQQAIAIHAGTRGSSHTPVPADRAEGLALSIELPQSSAYSSYVFELYDPNGKQAWTRTIARSNTDSGDDSAVSLVVPGSGLFEGSYTLNILGVTPQSGRVEIDRRVLDVHFEN